MHMLGERIVVLLLLTLWLDLFAPVVLSTSFRIREDLCSKQQLRPCAVYTGNT